MLRAIYQAAQKALDEDRNRVRASIDLEKFTLAPTGFVNYPESPYYNVTIDEYVFTVINETGQDLKKCFILLDEFWMKSDFLTEGKWKLDAENMFDKPFRWNRANIPVDGKIDIDNGDRAQFILMRLLRSSILNVTKNENEPHLDFRLAFLGEEGHGLSTGWEHCLRIGIRARDTSDNSVLVRYSIYVQPHSEKGLEDIKIVREEIGEKNLPPQKTKRRKKGSLH